MSKPIRHSLSYRFTPLNLTAALAFFLLYGAPTLAAPAKPAQKAQKKAPRKAQRKTPRKAQQKTPPGATGDDFTALTPVSTPIFGANVQKTTEPLAVIRALPLGDLALRGDDVAAPLALTTQSSAMVTPPAENSGFGGNPAALQFAPAPLATDKTLVTNSFTDTDLRQALSDIAAQTGVSIIADNTVAGTVSLDLQNVPLERALSMLLQSGGFAFAKMDGYYIVGAAEPTNPNFYLFSQTEIVQLKHIRPEVVLSLLAVPYGRYLSSEGPTPIVTARGGALDEGRRSAGSFGGYGGGGEGNSADSDIGRPAATYKVAITASPAIIARIKADIARLDQPRQQVMLEALVLEISQDELNNLGFNFGSKYFSVNTLGTAGGNNGTFAYSSVSRDQLVQISALAQKGAVRVRANPRVATGDGQTANMEVGRENYFTITSGAVNFAYNTLEVIRSGISLRITPRILEDSNEVTALVEPEVRDVTGNSANGLPEISFRRAATNVRVRDGESIVIGGLINEFTTNTKTKIPILGDIPLIGGLFRGTNSRKLRSETVIIVTPRILRDGETRDGIVTPALEEDLRAYRANNRRNSASAAPALPPFVAPKPGVPEVNAPKPEVL